MLDVLSNIIFGIAGNTSYDIIRSALRSALSFLPDNHDLQAALITTFKQTLKHLQQVQTEDGRKILQQLYDDTSKLFPRESNSRLEAILQAVLTSKEDNLQRLLWTYIESYLTSEPPDFIIELERRLPIVFITIFGDTLREEPYKKAWIDFQRLLLQEIYRQLNEQIAQQGIEQQQSFDKILTRIEILVTVPHLLAQLAQAIAQMLSFIQESRERTKQELNYQLATLDKMLRTLEEVRNLTEGCYIKEGEVVDYPLRYHDDALLQELSTGTPFVGRDQAIKELIDFTSSGGYLLIVAPAGAGKSTLMAHLLRTLAQQTTVCYHFFNTQYHTNDFTSFIACLAEQLLQEHHIRGQVRESEPSKLQTIIAKTLSMPHPSQLVIIVDGLDEAYDQRYPNKFAFPRGLFPETLGEKITVIFTIRSIEGENTANEIRNQLGLPLRSFLLSMLNAQAVCELLQQSTNEQLNKKIEDLRFVDQILDKTGGLAIYLRYLVEDLEYINEKDWERAVELLPRKFSDFVKRAAQEVNAKPMWRDALRYLALAKGPLSTNDLLILTESSGNPMQLEDLDSIPWNIQRWLIRQEDNWLFQHTSIRDTYAKVYLRDRLADKYLQYLLDYCANWQEHHSSYTLRHYVEHLWDRKLWDTLFALIQNESFVTMQQEFLPSEPDLPLKATQIALLGSAIADNAPMIVKFLFLHAYRYTATRQKSPLDALRTGSLFQAWNLTNLHANEYSVLWYLLLSWELFDKNTLPDALSTLQRLAERTLPNLEQADTHKVFERLRQYGHISIAFWLGDSAQYLLTHLSSIKETLFTYLYQRLLDHGMHIKLCNQLAKHGYFISALKMVDTLETTHSRIEALIAIAKFQAEAGQKENAHTSIARALQEFENTEITDKQSSALDGYTSQALFDKNEHSELLSKIVIAQARAGEIVNALQQIPRIHAEHYTEVMQAIAQAQTQAKEFKAALETARKIHAKKFQARVLRDILVAQLQLNKREEGRATLAFLQDLAESSLSSEDLPLILGEFALAQLLAGHKKKSRISLSLAIKNAIKIKDKGKGFEMLGTMAALQLEAGDLIGFKKIIKNIGMGKEEEDALAKALNKIAKAAIQKEKIDSLLKVAQKVKNKETQAHLLRITVSAQVDEGNFTAALQTVQLLHGSHLQLQTLEDILIGQTRAGDLKGALRLIMGFSHQEQQAAMLMKVSKVLEEIDQMEMARTLVADALQLAEEVDGTQERRQALAGIAITQARAGDVTSALQTIKHIEDEKDKIQALGAIIVANAQTGAFEIALQSVQNITNLELQINTLREIAIVQAQANRTEEAKATLTLAIETTQKIETERDRWKILTPLIAAQIKIGDMDAALETASSIGAPDIIAWTIEHITPMLPPKRADTLISLLLKVSRESEDKIKQNALLRYVAIAQARLGKFSEALEIAQKISSDRDLTLKKIAIVEAEFGKFAEALETTHLIEEKVEREVALLDIIEEEIKAKDVSAAFEIAQKIEYKGAKVLALTKIAIAQALQGQRELAQAAFSAAQDIAHGLGKQESDSFKWGRAFLDDSGFLIEERLGWLNDQSTLLKAIAVAQAQAGFGRDALQTVKMINIDHSEQLLEIAAEFVKTGNREDFKMMLIPCADHISSVYLMSKIVAQSYPEHTNAIVKVITEFSLPSFFDASLKKRISEL